MMFLAQAKRTMAGARQVVEDRPIDLRPAHRRQKVIAIANVWNLAKKAEEAKQRQAEEQRIAAEREEARLVAIQEAREAHERSGPAASIIPDVQGSARELIGRVAAWHGLTYQDIIGRSRNRAIVEARFDAVAAVYLLRTISGRQFSLPQLGRVFGGRDHTTVLYALRQRGIKFKRVNG